MKINKIILLATLVVVTGPSVALAVTDVMPIQAKSTTVLGNEVSSTVKINANSKTELPVNASVKAQAKNNVETSPSEENKNKDEHSAMGDTHRSAVATFVQSLLKVANREGGIGAQVRLIAQAQNDSEKETTDALVKIENRGGFKTFFIGADYKNIGVVRRHMVTTANQIAELKVLADKATNSNDKAELQAQIVILEQEQAKIDLFIKKYENKFSLFGWMLK